MTIISPKSTTRIILTAGIILTATKECVSASSHTMYISTLSEQSLIATSPAATASGSRTAETQASSSSGRRRSSPRRPARRARRWTSTEATADTRSSPWATLRPLRRSHRCFTARPRSSCGRTEPTASNLTCSSRWVTRALLGSQNSTLTHFSIPTKSVDE